MVTRRSDVGCALNCPHSMIHFCKGNFHTYLMQKIKLLSTQSVNMKNVFFVPSGPCIKELCFFECCEMWRRCIIQSHSVTKLQLCLFVFVADATPMGQHTYPVNIKTSTWFWKDADSGDSVRLGVTSDTCMPLTESLLTGGPGGRCLQEHGWET